jgi:hypothetical protein
MTITVGLPCELLDVRVRVAPSEHLTPLEEVMLRAVGSGVDDFGDLDGLLGLGTRITVDMLLGLWRRSYVRIDVQRGRVVLSPEVACILVEEPGRLQDLSPGRIDEEIWQVAVDVVSGRIVPIEQTTGPRDLLVAPAVTVQPAVASVRAEAVLAAVTSSQRIRLGDSPDARCILSVDLASVRGREVRKRRKRFLPVVVTASRNEDGEVAARVARDEPIAPVHRDRIDRYLAEQLEFPKSRFAQSIAGQASDQYAATPSLPDRLDRLRQRVERLSDAAPGTWDEHQHALENLAVAVRRELDARTGGETTRLVIGPDEQHRALLDAVATATHQVVLVGPRVDRHPFNDLADVVIDALRRGVRVFLLWGRNHEDALPDQVLNLLLTIRDQFPGRLVFAERSARTHANLAVCDDRWALVSSLNPMGARRGLVEAGLVVEVGPAGGWSPVEEILRWARDAYPDYPVARGLLVASESFRSPAEPQSRRTDQESGITLPSIDEVSAGTPDLTPLRDLWRREWAAVVDDLGERVERLPTHVDRLVADGMHRTVLDDALGTARHRLLVSSRMLSTTVVTDRFFNQIEERIRAGVQVRLVHGQWAHSPDQANEHVRETFARLSAEHAEAFEVRRVDDWRANVLVCDNRTTIGSFDFLSFDGYHRPGRLSHRSDLGLSVVGADLADRVTHEVCTRAGVTVPAVIPPADIPRLRVVPALVDIGSDGDTDTGATDDAETRVVRLARELIEASPEERRALVADRSVDLQRLLAVLDEVDATPEIIGDMAAAVLSSASGPDGLAAWADRLVDTFWRQRRFVEAMLLRQHFGGEQRPSGWVTELGAYATTEAFDEWLDTFDVADLEVDERTALSIVVTAEVLLPSSRAAVNNAPVLLSLLASDEPDGVLPAVVLDHWERHGPLPVGYLESWATTSAWRQLAHAQTESVVKAVERWRTAAPPGPASQKLRGFLNRANSPAGDLVEALAAGADGLPHHAAVAAWFDTHGSVGPDKLFARIEEETDRWARTRGRGRVNYVDRVVGPVLEAVAALLEILSDDKSDATALVDVVALLRDELSLALALVEDAVAALPWDLQLVVGPSLERLRRLTEGDET